jgi:hypothetical protein
LYGECKTDGTTNCLIGSICFEINPYYWQCKPDPSQYKTEKCTNDYLDCSTQKTCCSDAFSCTQSPATPSVSACIPIQPPHCYMEIPSTSVVPSAFPYFIATPNNIEQSIVPTMQQLNNPSNAQSKDYICLFGECRSDGSANCLFGSLCFELNSFYSQCQPDYSKYKTTHCAYDYHDCSTQFTCCSDSFACTQSPATPLIWACIPIQPPNCFMGPSLLLT